MDQKQATIISLTDNAADKVKGLMEQEGGEDLALRIGVRPVDAPGSSTPSTSTTSRGRRRDHRGQGRQGAYRRHERPVHHGQRVRLRGRPPGRRLRRQQPERAGRLWLRQLLYLLKEFSIRESGPGLYGSGLFLCSDFLAGDRVTGKVYRLWSGELENIYFEEEQRFRQFWVWGYRTGGFGKFAGHHLQEMDGGRTGRGTGRNSDHVRCRRRRTAPFLHDEARHEARLGPPQLAVPSSAPQRNFSKRHRPLGGALL